MENQSSLSPIWSNGAHTSMISSPKSRRAKDTRRHRIGRIFLAPAVAGTRLIFRDIGRHPRKGLSTCPEQHCGPMKIKKCPLSLGEATDIDGGLGSDAHAFERGSMGHRRNDQGAGVFKTDEAALEQMVDGGCEQDPVLAIQPLFVCGIPPRLAMAG